MKILSDENIPFAREVFSGLGEVVTCPGREIDGEKLRDVEILLVRSTTKVDAGLVDESPVRLVATPTAGTDHVNLGDLAERNIVFSSAPGSNAESVAQYLTASLLVLANRRGFDLAGMTIGVVGVGHVGSRVARNAEALGMNVLLNDPPLERETGDPKYLPIEALFEADFLTFHVPLTRGGADDTYQMVDSRFLRRMKRGSVLINTSRGAVVDNAALLNALEQEVLSGAILDTWDKEPTVSLELLKKVDIGTPHIAGYAFDGKVRGVRAIYEAACDFAGVKPNWNSADFLPAPRTPSLTLNPNGKNGLQQNLLHAVSRIYDIERDDAALRQSFKLPTEERGSYFDRLRSEYPRRREFCNTEITLEPFHNSLAETLKSLQFQVCAET